MNMKRYGISIPALLALCSSAFALDQGVRSQLLRLDPVTRLEQRCDIEVMERIKQEHKQYSPDRVVAYATNDPKIDHDEIKTRGAAFRSKGQWYSLRFDCLTEADHLTVRSVRYRIGDAIPKDEWTTYNLWP